MQFPSFGIIPPRTVPSSMSLPASSLYSSEISVDGSFGSVHTPTISVRYASLFALRALAITCVIMIHVLARLKGNVMVFYDGTLNFNWVFGDFFYVTTVIGVDLFLMLSGALLLGREWNIKSFLGKRLPRIIEPFIFWGIVLSLFVISIQYFNPGFLHVIDGFNITNIVNFIIGAWRHTSWGFGPYWFFWMILGTYLIMPIFNKWLLHADLKEAEYFLVIWLITCIFDYTLFINFPIKITYFSGPIGMVVAGYYLRHTQRKIFTNKYLPIILIVGVIACEIYASFLLSSPTKLVKFDRYSIFSAIEVIGVFLLFRNFSDIKINNKFLKVPDKIFHSSVASIAKYSYGIYLLDQVIINLVIRVLKVCHFNGYKSSIILAFILSFGVCWLIMAIFNRIPYVNRVIGAK